MGGKVKSVFVFLLFIPSISMAAVQKLSPSGGDVEFLAITKPSFIKVHGTGAPASGQIIWDGDKVEGKFNFDLASLDTGMSMRNAHMKNKYLQVEKFPKATLELKSVQPLASWSLNHPKVADADFEGVMTLHGESQPVKGKFSIDDKGAVEVNFKVKLTDFKIEQPSFAGVTVQNDVDVTVKIDQLKAI